MDVMKHCSTQIRNLQAAVFWSLRKKIVSFKQGLTTRKNYSKSKKESKKFKKA